MEITNPEWIMLSFILIFFTFLIYIHNTYENDRNITQTVIPAEKTI